MKNRLNLQGKLSLFFLLLLGGFFWAAGLVEARRAERGWWLVLLLLAAALAIWSFGVSRILTRPLKEILEAAGKYADGILHWKLRLGDRRDELGKLSRRLNRMAETLGGTVDRLSQNLAETQALLEGMEEGVLILDLNGKIRTVNGAMKAILGPAHPADAGKHYLEVFRDPELTELIQSTLADKKGHRRALSPLGRPGKSFQVQSSLVSYPERGGEGVIVVFHDVTDLKRLERVRQDFVANASHELRTPLTAVKGYVEALRDKGLGDSRQAQQFLQVIERHADRMDKIVSDLLLLSEMESPDRALKKEFLSFPDLISSAVEVLHPQAEAKGQTIRVEIQGQIPPVSGDAQKIHQVILNLLGNAVSYTPEGGQIAIEARAADQGAEISVSDNGIGIPPQDLRRIFERFYRVDKARSRDEGGTGLGLSIVKHIAEAHGGWVKVESRPGRGSRFYFFLPRS